MDRIDPEARSRIMRSIRTRDTKPELVLRRRLHARGFRFRIHVGRLKGRPDMVLKKYGACIFVHGCFWHRHGCRRTTIPEQNVGFWKTKFETNVARDANVVATLRAEGWRVLTVWECGLTSVASANATADAVAEWLVGSDQEGVLPEVPSGQPTSPSRVSRASPK